MFFLFKAGKVVHMARRKFPSLYKQRPEAHEQNGDGQQSDGYNEKFHAVPAEIWCKYRKVGAKFRHNSILFCNLGGEKRVI